MLCKPLDCLRVREQLREVVFGDGEMKYIWTIGLFNILDRHLKGRKFALDYVSGPAKREPSGLEKAVHHLP